MFADRIIQQTTVYDPWSSGRAYATPDCDSGIDVENSERRIDVDAAGEFLLEHYRAEIEHAEYRLPFAEDAARILSDGAYAIARVLRPDLTEDEKREAKEVTWKTRTKEKFLGTLFFLITVGLMVAASEKEAQALTKHFQVPKGADAWRIISDARIFNWLCCVPPGVNLPFLKTLLVEISMLGATHAVVLDWRYWFYQLPINATLQQYFVMSCAGKFFRLRCLPMGWSWSPRIAQCVGWGVILYRAKVKGVLEDPLGVYETWGPDPPIFVKLRDGPGGAVVGLIFLWYDNVMVICKDPALRDKWYDRLLLNCQRFNSKIKEIKRTSRPNYLGIHFWAGQEGVRWCHESERTEKWKECVAAPVETPRDVARLLGIIIWHYAVAMLPLLHVWQLIEVMKRVSRSLVDKGSWDKPLKDLGIALSVMEVKMLRQYVRAAIHNPPCSTNVHQATETVYAAADACKDDVRPDGQRVSGGGWLLYRSTYCPKSRDFLHDRLDWLPTEALLSIHILEAKAVLALLQWMPPATHLTRLVLGEDNTIVVAALSKGYSSCQQTCQLVKEILELCRQKNYLLEVIWVPTKENAADPISRSLEPCDDRNERTWRILHGEAPLTAKKGKRDREAPSTMVSKVPDSNPHAQELEVALCCLNGEEES